MDPARPAPVPPAFLPPPPPPYRPAPAPKLPGWGWYLAWALVGAGAMLSLLAILTIGIFIAPFVGLAGLVLLSRERGRAAATALVAGPALPLLFVAWLNHDGPGNICTTTATSQSCVEEWSPWPWLLAAVGFIAAGVVASLAYRRSLTRAQARHEAASAYQFGTEMPPRR